MKMKMAINLCFTRMLPAVPLLALTTAKQITYEQELRLYDQYQHTVSLNHMRYQAVVHLLLHHIQIANMEEAGAQQHTVTLSKTTRTRDPNPHTPELIRVPRKRGDNVKLQVDLGLEG